jgi:ribosome-binding ATPase YchF (GTP1/OBG family)
MAYNTELNTQIQPKKDEIATLTGDEKKIAEALMNFVIKTRDENAAKLVTTTQEYNEEFNRRKREKQEELFWQRMDQEQNSVNQLWQQYYNSQSVINILY